MAQSYISLKKSAPVVLGHICSNCGFPILTVATIHTDATQYYTFSQTKAQETAEQECNKAIRFEKERIKAAIHKREPLSVDVNVVSGWHYGSHCDSSIKGVTTPCPNCCNIEKIACCNVRIIDRTEFSETSFISGYLPQTELELLTIILLSINAFSPEIVDCYFGGESKNADSIAYIWQLIKNNDSPINNL